MADTPASEKETQDRGYCWPVHSDGVDDVSLGAAADAQEAVHGQKQNARSRVSWKCAADDAQEALRQVAEEQGELEEQMETRPGPLT